MVSPSMSGHFIDVMFNGISFDNYVNAHAIVKPQPLFLYCINIQRLSFRPSHAIRPG